MDAENQGTDVAGAAGQIEALMRGKGAETAGDAGDAGDEREAGQDDGGAQSGDEGQAGADEREGEGAEGQADEGGETEDAGDAGQDDADLVEVDHNGRKLKIPKEIADGALRQQDYSRKTEALAREREAFVARAKHLELNEKTFKELAPLDFQVQNLQQQIRDLSGNKPDPMVDLMGYLSREKQIGDLMAALEQVQTSVTERRTALQREQATATADLQRQLLATLAREIPNWGDQANAEISNTLLKSGFTRQEVAEMTDPRIALMAYKAAKLDRQEAARGGLTAKKGTASAAPVVRPSASVNKASASRTVVEKAKAKVQKTGDQRDAAAAILAAMRAKRR